MKIHHISITSENIKEDLKFYQDIFGFKIFKQYKDSEMEIYLLRADIILEIFWFKEFYKLPEYKKDLDKDIRTVGINHFAFAVSDLKKFKNNLDKKKIKIYKDITKGKILKYIFLKDYSGNLVEVVEDSDKSKQFTVDNLAEIQFEGGDKNMSKDIDKYIY